MKYAISSLIFVLLFSSCKKKVERDLIKSYIGTYSVAETHTHIGATPGDVTNTTKFYEFEVKKSIKGMKIKGVSTFENFIVDAKDSTLSASDNKTQASAYGYLLPNDSIFIRVTPSPKVSEYTSYKMKKIN